jgi:two-component system, LytTR family, response regulator LytT
MKAEMTLSKEHSPLCIDVKKEKKTYPKPQLRKFVSKEEVQKGKAELLVIPIDQLTDVLMRQIQGLPGAYMLPADHSSKIDSKLSSFQEDATEPGSKQYKKRFLVKHSSKLISLEIDQIAYFYAENRLNFIKTWNNKTYIVDKTIEEISSIVNKSEFFRINRSYIIAYKSIDEVYMHFNNRLKLKLNIAVPEELFVSKDRVAGFKEWLGA